MPRLAPALVLAACASLGAATPPPTPPAPSAPLWSHHTPASVARRAALAAHGADAAADGDDGIFSCDEYATNVTQPLDHSDPEGASFLQRVLVNAQYDSGAADAPVFVYVSGEVPLEDGELCPGNQFMSDVAREQGALMVALEHRYFGASQPFDELTTENMAAGLSPDAAVADAVAAVAELTAELGLEGRPWVSWGGSYAGVLSTWLRAAAPDAVVGSVSSSAPMQFSTMNGVYLDVGMASAAKVEPRCAMQYRQVVSGLLQDWSNSAAGRARLQKALNPCVPVDGDDGDEALAAMVLGGFFNMGSAMQYYVSWGGAQSVNQFCEPFLNATDAGQPLLEAFYSASEALGYVVDYDGGRCLYNFYDGLVNSTAGTLDAHAGQYMRQWNYLSATSFGGWIALPGTPLTPDFFAGLMQDAFGLAAPAAPPVDDYNEDILGGWRANTSNVFFVNGDLDGWSGLGVLSPNAPEQQAYVVANGSHCEDMYSGLLLPIAATNEEEAQEEIKAAVKSWVV